MEKSNQKNKEGRKRPRSGKYFHSQDKLPTRQQSKCLLISFKDALFNARKSAGETFLTPRFVQSPTWLMVKSQRVARTE
jgi:hypothetical protein